MTGPPLLVIGYGNPLRSDDGVGPYVAEALETEHLEGVGTLSLHQLSPEHAEPVSKAETVVFVDASLEGPSAPCLCRIDPRESSRLLAHAADPRTLLAMARDLFDHAPEAWLLTVRARNLGFGESLEPETRADADRAISMLREFAARRPQRAARLR